MTSEIDRGDAGRQDAETVPPTVAGIYDAMLGGQHHTPAEREAMDRLREVEPLIPAAAWTNRGFLQRATRWLTSEAGVDQLVDIGSGLPTASNTHDVAGPGCRVVYVDNDPEVVRQSTQLLDGQDTVSSLQADFCDPGLLDAPEVRRLINLERPVGLIMVGLLYFVSAEQGAYDRMAELVERVPSGSYLAFSHVVIDGQDPGLVQQLQRRYDNTGNHMMARTTEQVRPFLDGLDIVPPYPGAAADLAYAGLWGAEDPAEADDDAARWLVAAVARKP